MFDQTQTTLIKTLADTYADVMVWQKTGKALNATAKVKRYIEASDAAGILLISQSDISRLGNQAWQQDNDRANAIRFARATVVKTKDSGFVL